MQGKRMFPLCFPWRHIGEWRYIPLILDCGLSFTPWVLNPLPPGQKCPALYSMNRDCVGCRTGLNALEKKNISCLCWKSKHNSLVFQPSLVIIETENYRPPSVNAFCNTADKYYKEGCTVAVWQLGRTLTVK
jgi:hypothetical protein